MATIDSILKPIDGYLFLMSRNTVNGWYELQIGIPNSWVFNNNEEIECEVLQESDDGKLIRIAPKVENVIVDDLVKFVEIILQTNERIAAKEKQFTQKMEEMRNILEDEAKKFYEELDELKENSFQDIGGNLQKLPIKKETRGRPKSNPPSTPTTTAKKKETRGRKPKQSSVTTDN